MMNSIPNIFKIPELKRRILFTLGIIALFRIGCHIPTPGIDGAALGDYIKNASNSLLGFYDIFTGGALSRAAIFGLGIMPYISASIVIQLLGSVVPYFQRLQKEGEEGRKKINQLTRYGTVFIAAMQALASSVFLQQNDLAFDSYNPIQFYFTVMITLTSGTILLMWLGEQITDRGIGNGISLLIFAGIVDRFPQALKDEIVQWIKGNEMFLKIAFIFGILFVIIVGVVLITEGTRKIPVQYAKRVIGRKIYGGQSTYIPIRVSGFGVMAIIFAQSLMFVPQTIAQLFSKYAWVTNVMSPLIRADSLVYWFFYAVLIVFFTYFYAAIAFNPTDVADNMQKQGGFIPGVRPGKKTADYIDHVLSRIMLPAALFFSLIAIMPYFVTKYFHLTPRFSQFFGGTSILIMVGVALDTLQQIESHLVMRHYDGFLKSGRIRGRR
jgi:preprotein translocase subunit SecY